MSGAPSGSFAATAARAASYRWLERRLFEVVGGWVPAVAEPGPKLALRVQSFAHAARAERWERLLPVPPAPPADPEAAAGRGAGGPAPLVDALVACSTTPGRLTAVWGLVLPWLLERYRADRAASTVASGGPEGRLLDDLVGQIRAELEGGAGLAAAAGTGGSDDVDALERLRAATRGYERD